MSVEKYPNHKKAPFPVKAAATVLAATGLYAGYKVTEPFMNGTNKNQAPIEASHEVKQGENLFGIAQDMEPGRDPRPLADKLEAKYGDNIQPGEMIDNPDVKPGDAVQNQSNQLPNDK